MNDDIDKNVRRRLERSAPDYIKFTALYPHERANARTGLFQDGETWFWGEDDGTGRIDCWPVEPSHPLIDLALSVEEEQSRRERNLDMNNNGAAVTIRNFTPHQVTLILPDKELHFPSEGVARVEASTQPAYRLGKILLTSTVFGEVTGLPPETDSTWLIVSRVVASALPNRSDLLVPNELVRDDQGRVIGCRSLEMPS